MQPGRGGLPVTRPAEICDAELQSRAARAAEQGGPLALQRRGVPREANDLSGVSGFPGLTVLTASREAAALTVLTPQMGH